MKIGFIGFGDVGSTLASCLLNEGIEICTCIQDRSSKTQKIAEEMELILYKSNRELAQNTEILISAVNPKAAIKVAKDIGEHFNGIYIDMNNISPKTAIKTLSFIKNGKVVDASIIGTIREGLSVPIIASGPYADKFAELNLYGMNITVIGAEIGQASAIKILRSSYTKGTSALLFETFYSAYQMGIDQEVLEYISKTECGDFKDSAISRIISSAYQAKRRYEEMDEVIELLSETEDPKMSMATQDRFKELHEALGDLDKRPENYAQIFEQIKSRRMKK